MTRCALASLLGLLWLAAPAAQAADAVVLDTTGFWRIRETLRPPVIAFADGTRQVTFKQQWIESPTDEPPVGWTSDEFDDSAWLRGPARMASLTPLLSHLCLRGSFTVTDQSKVGDLKLSVGYRGGLVVYLNGREIARRNLPAGPLAKDTLADVYGPEACAPDWGWGGAPPRGDPQAEPAAMKPLRTRTLDALPIPAEAIRKGQNVLALEIIRAPYDKILDERKNKPWQRQCPYQFHFNSCEINFVQLTAGRAEGLVTGAVRLPGLRLWNTNLLTADYDLDFGGQGETLYPVRIVGARGGAFSGKVVVGSAEPIKGLAVTVSDLKSPDGGVIPASAVRVRYGLPWGGERGAYYGLQTDYFFGVTPDHSRYARPVRMLGALAEKPLAEFPVAALAPGKYDLKAPNQPDPVPGAVAPVWLTVSVPRDAKAGLYKGQVTVSAAGAAPKPLVAAVELEVADWTLPETPGAGTWVELIQSPDTLAREYGEPLWSERNWAMTAHSMDLLREVGCDVVYLPVIAETNLGNAESMVRWIKGPGGSYTFDFSIMDRYLDTALKHMGKPTVVCFVVWEIYLGGNDGYKDEYSHNESYVKARSRFVGQGPLVTVLEKATGKTTTEHVPSYTDPAMKAVYKSLFDQLRQRMRQRGLEGAMMIGLMSDDWPSKAESEFYAETSGRLPWVSHSHMGIPDNGKISYGSGGVPGGRRTLDISYMKVGYHSAVMNDNMADNDPPTGSNYGWKLSTIVAYQPRYETGQTSSRWYHLMEMNIAGFQRGVARGGADFWGLKDNRGRRVGNAGELYPHSLWRNLDIPWHLLAPGPDGPVATQHFEAFRAGLQACEARIAIERAMVDPALKARLGDDLANRCQALLVRRTQDMMKACTCLGLCTATRQDVTATGFVVRQGSMAGHGWFAGSGWEVRERDLFALAGQVAAKLGGK